MVFHLLAGSVVTKLSRHFQIVSSLPHKPLIIGGSRFRRWNHGKAGSTILEINGGVGGSEAMLFAAEMLELYLKYCSHSRWTYKLEEQVTGDLGGLRSARIVIHAPDSFNRLIQEAGVHRVQRVPKTEKYGRMQTSTVAVSVVPKSVLDIVINDRDLEIQTKRSSGPGGQHVNKTESAVRMIHKPTGVAAESQESRFQMENRKTARRRLLERLQALELEKLTSQMGQLRKSQVGHADRNEKIRTYNYPQDRITDHRIGKSYYNLRGLFAGEMSVLDKIINDFHGLK